MAMHECEAYWQDLLRRPKEQQLMRTEQKRLQKEAADQLNAMKHAKLKEVEDALGRCTPDQQKLLRPILKAPGLLEHLHDCLLRSDRNASTFSKRIETDQPLATRILEKAEEYERDPKAFERQEHCMQELYKEAVRPIDMADLNYLKERTWKDLPPAELADRMSKGEICPREEWVPGISKGKRPLDTQTLNEHLSFGDRLALEGRQAYAAGDWLHAFLRFKQGVELVNWIEAKVKEQQNRVTDMYSMFLRNVAQASLKLEKYQEAIRACTTIIQEIDEHDSKARYRRGRAYLFLGMAKCAKDDFMFILKSPYSTNEGVHAARLGLRELRRIVSRSETETKTTLTKGINGGLFSKDRVAESETLYANSSPQTNNFNSNDEEEEEEEEGFRLPPLHKSMENKNANFKKSADEDPNEFLSHSPEAADANDNSACKFETSKENTACGDSTKRPPLSLEKTRDILLDLLETYTSEPVASQLNELRSLADFDYRRIVIRARKFLPQVQGPILERHEVSGESHRSKMRVLEKSVAFWRFQDAEIAALTRDCLDAIFGDAADIEL